jgi:hypothetical protein
MLAAATTASAQTPITWHISFDPGADRVMDSLDGCWQVGAPDKTVFDSAWSAPNALVTDTLQPYPVGGISYATFSVPVNFFGEEVELTFRHRLQIDPGEAYGWIEWYDQYAPAWVKTDPWQTWSTGFVEWAGDGIDTDSALVFTGTNNGWGQVQLYWRCIGALQGPNERASYPDSMLFRFAFQALANTNGRDGWMIDDLVVTNNGCSGGIEEGRLATLSASPNPASDLLFLARTGNGTVRLELYRADGALVRRERMTGERHVLDLGGLPEGPYLLRADGSGAQVTRRVMVLR